MIKKYKNRPVKKIEEVLRFEYSNKGIQDLKDFVGLAFIYADKYRHIGSIGEAGLDINGTKRVLREGDYISKDENGELDIMDYNYFINVYEEI